MSAVPEQQSTQQTCHTCLAPLPEGSAELQQAKGVIVDKVSGHYKQYCSEACCDADTARVTTGPIHAAIPRIATSTACDATLLHLILELDAHRQLDKQRQAVNDTAANQQNGTADNQHDANDAALSIFKCTLADVEALSSPWDRNTKAWREALTAGGCISDASCIFACMDLRGNQSFTVHLQCQCNIQDIC